LFYHGIGDASFRKKSVGSDFSGKKRGQAQTSKPMDEAFV